MLISTWIILSGSLVSISLFWFCPKEASNSIGISIDVPGLFSWNIQNIKINKKKNRNFFKEEKLFCKHKTLFCKDIGKKKHYFSLTWGQNERSVRKPEEPEIGARSVRFGDPSEISLIQSYKKEDMKLNKLFNLSSKVTHWVQWSLNNVSTFYRSFYVTCFFYWICLLLFYSYIGLGDYPY